MERDELRAWPKLVTVVFELAHHLDTSLVWTTSTFAHPDGKSPRYTGSNCDSGPSELVRHGLGLVHARHGPSSTQQLIGH